MLKLLLHRTRAPLPASSSPQRLDNFGGDASCRNANVNKEASAGPSTATSAAGSGPASSSAAAAAPAAADSDLDSVDLLAGARTGLRVPPHVGWAHLALALPGLALAIAAACLSVGGAGGIGDGGVPNDFGASDALGLPLWCSLSMLMCAALALCYAKRPLRKLLTAYRIATVLSLVLHSIGLLPLPAAPGFARHLWPMRIAQSLLLAAGWCLLLACALSDICVGRSLCQVADIFGRAVCRARHGRRASSFPLGLNDYGGNSGLHCSAVHCNENGCGCN